MYVITIHLSCDVPGECITTQIKSNVTVRTRGWSFTVRCKGGYIPYTTVSDYRHARLYQYIVINDIRYKLLQICFDVFNVCSSMPRVLGKAYTPADSGYTGYTYYVSHTGLYTVHTTRVGINIHVWVIQPI